MTTELGTTQVEQQKQAVKYRGGSPDTVYGMGMFGAWAYYIGRAETWRERGIGFVKGLFWPAFVVYAALKLLEKE